MSVRVPDSVIVVICYKRLYSVLRYRVSVLIVYLFTFIILHVVGIFITPAVVYRIERVVLFFVKLVIEISALYAVAVVGLPRLVCMFASGGNAVTYLFCTDEHLVVLLQSKLIVPVCMLVKPELIEFFKVV